MSTVEEQLARLRAFKDSLLDGDDELAESVGAGNEGLELKRPPEEDLGNEAIIMRRLRPVLAVKKGTAELVFEDKDDEPIWRKRLEDAEAKLKSVIPSVGRIELLGHPDMSWVGTGWLVRDNCIVTNRHVASVFAEAQRDAFAVQSGMQASIDLLQEIGREDKQTFDIIGVKYIEEDGLDIAFLEVAQIDGAVATPIALSSKPSASAMIAAIGYPAFDSRTPDVELMERIYGRTYNKKRLAPGTITEIDESRVLHTCTTLGGNSGSALVDLATGEAIGLHFRGKFMKSNFAVRSDLVLQRLDEVLAGKRRKKKAAATESATTERRTNTEDRPRAKMTGGGSTSFTIPLTITVSLGDGAASVTTHVPRPVDHDGDDPDDIPDTDPELPADDGNEAAVTAESYKNRKGYDDDFLGKKFRIALPDVVKAKADILTFDGGRHVLTYEHFSVVMNAKRRQCFFSACNIDGARSKSSKRTPWRYDPRIPRDMQIMKECYGNPPRFSRGHMTRREDPAWGTAAELQRGADDSMHVTNVTPQLQSFNAPIWLALEDYALQNARQDDQKISVFTGPYFAASDRKKWGVKIPVKFWKVIAFVHDKTKELCATGYEMSQKKNLEVIGEAGDEHVFGDFRSPQLNISTQVSLATIERRSGLSFGELMDVDTFDDSESVGGEREIPLTHPSQIRWV
ncbi:MAG: DNA/RNA non-specific endonuclease [Kofleriaceae bacterium]